MFSLIVPEEERSFILPDEIRPSPRDPDRHMGRDETLKNPACLSCRAGLESSSLSDMLRRNRLRDDLLTGFSASFARYCCKGKYQSFRSSPLNLLVLSASLRLGCRCACVQHRTVAHVCRLETSRQHCNTCHTPENLCLACFAPYTLISRDGQASKECLRNSLMLN